MWFPVCRLSNHLQVRKVRISHFHSCLKFNPLTPTIIPGCASFRSSHHSGGSNLVTDHASFENKEGVGFVFLRFFNFSDFLSGKSCLFPVILDRGLRGGCEGVRRDVPHWTLTEPSLNPHWTLTEPPLNLYQIMKKFEGNVPRSMFRVYKNQKLLPINIGINIGDVRVHLWSCLVVIFQILLLTPPSADGLGG